MSTGRLSYLLGKGARLVPVVLIAGVPRIYTPAGVRPTTAATSPGTTVDPAWWPGTGTLTQTLPGPVTFDPVRDLLDAEAVWEVFEEVDPLKGEVKIEALHFEVHDEEGLATADFSSRSARVTNTLAADVSSSASSIPLADATAVPSSGLAFVGRETIMYDSVTGSDLDVNVSGRGKYGSIASAHTVNPLRPPVISFAGPRFIQGRRTSVWIAELSADGTTLTNPTPILFGVIGPGVQLTRRGLRWSVPIDPVTVSATQRFGNRKVNLYGVNHFYAGDNTFGTALYARTRNTFTGVVDEVFLTDANDSDNQNGWHPTWDDFFEAWKRVAATATTGITATGRNPLVIRGAVGGGNSLAMVVNADWSTNTRQQLDAEGEVNWSSGGPAPEAFIWLTGKLKVPDPVDFANVPSTLTYTVFTPTPGTARIALVADTDEEEALFVEVWERDAGAQTLTLRPRRRRSNPRFEVYDATPRKPLCTKPTVASVGIVARGETPWGAIRAAISASTALEGASFQGDSVDWDHILRQTLQIPLTGVPTAREYLFGAGDETILNTLADEFRLLGMVMATRYGRITGIRYGEFAGTENTVAAITEEDVLLESGGEEVEWEVIDQIQPLATGIDFLLPNEGSYRFVDSTYLAEFGEGETIECRALLSVPLGTSLTDLTNGLIEAGQRVLGPLGAPARHVRLPLTEEFLALQAGDLVTLTHSRIPNWNGTRGLTSALCQVVSMRRQNFGGRLRAMAELRLPTDDYSGYAPSGLIDPGGASAASPTITLDTTSGFGAGCFAQATDPQGNPVTRPTDGFSVGDKVDLCQINTRTPIAREPFTIVSLTDTTITLNGNPSASMAAAAASRYGVMIRFSGYDTSVATQYGYAYLADATPSLGTAADPPDRWAP